MALDEPKEGDHSVDAAGITWLISERDVPFVLTGEGVRIEHHKADWGSWFQVSRLNQPKGGCC